MCFHLLEQNSNQNGCTIHKLENVDNKEKDNQDAKLTEHQGKKIQIIEWAEVSKMHQN